MGSFNLNRAYAVLLLCAASAISSPAQTFKTLYSFCSKSDCTDGGYPVAGLAQATDGNFYGTTSGGGAYNAGTVFKITPGGALTTLYSFCSKSDCTDGGNPQAGLVQGTDGDLYGTTYGGGSGPNDGGTVFKMTPEGVLTTLHSFDGPEGANPQAGLVQATDGNFYGTTWSGGANKCPEGFSCGTVFKITPSGTLTRLHSFDGTDGAHPTAGLVQANGDLYGTTYQTVTGGTIFRITPGGVLTTLYTFCDGPCCSCPTNANQLIHAADGNFYGTTINGGDNSIPYGTVFRMTPSGVLTTLHSFDFTDGANPYGALVQATDGNFYGTTYAGANGPGTVFEITLNGTLKTLYSFCAETNSNGYCPDGADLAAGLIQATNGTFYGTTRFGGPDNDGTLFSLSVGLKPFVETQSTSGKEGAKIGILGQGFKSSSVVKFGGTKATTIRFSGTTFITATVPAGALTGAVTVTTGTTTLTSSKTFDVLPTITSFTPESGPAGTSVTIKGTGLKQTTKVTFEGKSGTFTAISDTEVKADVPAGAATGKIAVTTKGGSATSATSFTVN
jgi:uncharacterized repeat protein (TIGR03803 family)